jgi:subtilisin family serine protease
MGTREDVKDKRPTIEDLSHVNVTYTCRNPDVLLEMQGILENYKEFIDVGADLAFDAVDHWCSTQQSGRQFRDRASAHRLIGLKALADENLSGKDVNVVIVDRGLNEEDIVSKMKGRFGGGWAIDPDNGVPRIEPGTLRVVRGVTNNDHGMMIARNILAVAPEVNLYDLPLIPPRIAGIPTFLSDAHAAFERLMADLDRRGARDKGEKWILVNAWAPFDRTSERPPGNYSENPNHPFLKLISQMADKNIEMVFAAGNCGQFCPDSRCGAYDVGPGKSVHGANAHPKVLTVGAITTHSIAIGSSSQGEGPVALAAEKPDLVAPSMFSENSDRHTRNGGTSAACAVAAGVLAALRQRWGPEEISPDVMKQCLRETARRPGTAKWDPRLGGGVINAEAALNHLAQRCKGDG